MTTTNAKRALVVGLGLSGLSSAPWLARHGYDVTVADSRAHPPGLGALHAELPGLRVHTGGFDPALFRDPGLLVVSPGLSLHEPLIAAARARGVDVLGDVELFARVATAPVLAITGANGKSTVTSLVGAMCQEAGLDTAVGGNIGVPVLDLLRLPSGIRDEAYALEENGGWEQVYYD